MANRFTKYAQPDLVNANPMFPGQLQGQSLNNEGQGLQNVHTRLENERVPLQNQNTRVQTQQTQQQVQFAPPKMDLDIKAQFDSNPYVKAYRDALPNAVSAMKAPDTAQGDLSVVYAFGKVMDPGSVVREGELNMANQTSPLLGQLQSYIGMINAGKRLPKSTRTGLIEAIRAKAGEYDRGYTSARELYMKKAKAAGLDPETVIGPHDAAPFQQVEQGYIDKATGKTGSKDLTPDQKAKFFDILQREGADKADEYLGQFGQRMKDKSAANRPYSKGLVNVGTYGDSYVGQGLSGANEGLASVLGAPADLARAAINLVPQGINAVANTNIPTLPEAFGGGQWWKDRLTDLGSIQAPTDDPAKQFVRRVGQSVGASAVPAGAAGSLGKLGAGLLSGLGGGIGAATAQRVAPGNTLAEIAGELAGGGVTGLGLAKFAQRNAQRQIEAQIPTVSDLKTEASGLYRQAENRGVAATPAQTRKLAADVRQTLRDEGQLGPKGKLTNADTATSKAVNLIDQYAGRQMKPKEMDTVRTVLSESRQSPDPSDRRLGNILLDQFDNFVSPLAPEFDQARSVASRYLQAQDLEQARDLAAARASQFTGSGFENALRTEYRGLDRNAIKGNNYFSPEVNEAIQKTARGTPASNFFRGMGRLAPTGPVAGMGSVVPGLGVAAMTTPTLGGLVGGGLAGAGMLGRTAATRMGIRAADEAELIARNGGKLPQAQLLPKSLADFAAWLAASQQPKYISLDSPER